MCQPKFCSQNFVHTSCHVNQNELSTMSLPHKGAITIILKKVLGKDTTFSSLCLNFDLLTG